MVVTEAHIDAALDYIDAHPEEHNQEHWCGTACCVWGHARRIAGLPESGQGPNWPEIEHTPRANMLRKLMHSGDRDVLHLMRAVRADGKIEITEKTLEVTADGRFCVDLSLTLQDFHLPPLR